MPCPLTHLRRLAIQALSVAVAIGIITPAPGLCASCTFASASSSQRHVNHKNDPARAHQTCCTRHTLNRTAAVQLASTHCKSIHSQSCHCNRRQADPANRATEPIASTGNQLAALPPARAAAILNSSELSFALPTIGDAPPPIPHRILHCSWII
jgi:hypothetical protein